MLDVLPPETILTTLSFIPLRQLCRLPQVSKSWNTFIHVNESSIYHAAAILHGFLPANVDIHDNQLSLEAWMDSRSWKDLCMKCFGMERRWEGNGCAKSVTITAPGNTVWRFKVDLEQQTVITTHFDGGLRVSAIQEDEVLWSLPRSEVCPYAHCEYDEGFLVFTRLVEILDVWRRKRDARLSPRPSTFKPDSFQERAQSNARQHPLSVSQDDRGAFIPWMTIIPPNPVLALRLVHSTLLVASASAQEAYLYDISTGSHKQTISLGGPRDPPVFVNYVELGPRHIFVCTMHDVLVYPLDANDAQTCLKFPNQIEGFHGHYETRAFRVDYNLFSPVYSPEAKRSSTLVECSLVRNIRPFVPSHQRNFQAVHVSPCGSHFVTIDKRGCLCIIRNFEKALRNGGSLLGCLTIIDMRHPILNLAFEADKRIVVYVQQHGIFVIPLASENLASVNTLTMQPQGYPRVLHATQVGSHEVIQFCSCLQLARAGLWYSLTEMHTNPVFGAANSPLYCINFGESE